jgi:hypothetical protein
VGSGAIFRRPLAALVAQLKSLEALALHAFARGRETGLRAPAYVEAHHSPDAVLERLAALFDRLIGERARRTQRAPVSSR